MVNDELLQFIRTQRSAGVSDGDIKKALKELGGWDDGDIAEAYSRLGAGAPMANQEIKHPDAMMVSPRQTAPAPSAQAAPVTTSPVEPRATTIAEPEWKQSAPVQTGSDPVAAPQSITNTALPKDSVNTPPGEAPKVDLDMASVADFGKLSEEVAREVGGSSSQSAPAPATDWSQKKVSEIGHATEKVAETRSPLQEGNQQQVTPRPLGEQSPLGAIQHKPLTTSTEQSFTPGARTTLAPRNDSVNLHSSQQDMMQAKEPALGQSQQMGSFGTLNQQPGNSGLQVGQPQAAPAPEDSPSLRGQIRPGMGMQAPVMATSGVGMTPGQGLSNSSMNRPMIDTRPFGNGGVMQSSLDNKPAKKSGGWGLVIILLILVGIAGAGYWYVTNGSGVPFLDELLGRASEQELVVPDSEMMEEDVSPEAEIIVERNPLVLADQLQSALAARSGMPADLGIELVGEGNAADLFVEYFGFTDAESTWRQDHPANIETTVELDEAERALIAGMANSAEFRWQPDSVYTDVILQSPETMAHLKVMLERGLATAILFANQGQLDEGRVLAENILATAHLLSTSPTLTPDLFELGIALESRALQELTTLYEGIATAATVNVLASYQGEVDAIESIWLVWRTEQQYLEQSVQYLAGLHQSGIEEISTTVVGSVYTDNQIDRQTVFNWLEVPSVSVHPLVLGSTLWSYSVLAELTSIPDESNQAVASLAAVGQTDSEAVQTLLAVYEAADLVELLAAR